MILLWYSRVRYIHYDETSAGIPVTLIIPSDQRQTFEQNLDLSVKQVFFIYGNRKTCLGHLKKTTSGRCYKKYKIDDFIKEQSPVLFTYDETPSWLFSKPKRAVAWSYL